VLGGAALARPVDIDLELFQFELPAMAVAALVLVPLAWPRLRIGRIEGGLLVVAFIGYTALTLIRGS
jgi:cation:H+ antiporter